MRVQDQSKRCEERDFETRVKRLRNRTKEEKGYRKRLRRENTLEIEKKESKTDLRQT